MAELTQSERKRTRTAGRTWLFRCLTLLFSIVFCLLLLELFLRLVPVTQVKPLTQHPMMDRGRNFLYPEQGRIHPYTSGMDDALRIALVGDSFTAGAGCDPEDSYGMRLERLLNYNENIAPVLVDIYAKGGTAAPSQIPMVKKALVQKPSLLILGICLNDAEDWAHQDKMNALRDGMMPILPPAWMRPLLRHSRVANLVFQKASAFRVKQGYRHYFNDIWEDGSAGAKGFFDAVAVIQKLCREANVPFCALVFPMFSYDLSAEGYAFTAVHQKINTVLSGMSIPCLDLFPTFEGKNPDRMQCFPGFDGHPSEIAHRLAAQELMFFLIDHDFLNRGYKPRLMSSSMNGYYGKIYRRVAAPEQFESKP